MNEMKRLSQSFAAKLSLRFMFLLTVAVILLSASFLLTVRFFVGKQQTVELKNAVQIIYKTLSFEPESKSFDIPYYLTYTVYRTDDGMQLATNDPFLPMLPDTHGKAERYFVKDFFYDGDMNLLYYAAPFILYEENGENVIIAAAMNMDNNSLALLFSNLPSAVLLMVLPVLAVSFLVSFFITQNTIKPVVKITKTARTMSSQNLTALLPVSRNNDEIDELSKTFNSLFERIKADFDRERNFSNDVSHELNTPLTVIKGNVNLLLRWGKDNPEQLQKSLNAIKTEASSMQTIITNLMQLARIESGRIKPELSSVNMKNLFCGIKEEFLQIAPEMTFVLNDNDAVVNTDAEMLHQILTALVSNSVKFAGKNCTVTLNAFTDNDSFIIEERDNGPGIPEDAVQHIFERFFRADESHSRKIEGSGLGLSIVRSLASVLNMKVSAWNIEPHGISFCLLYGNADSFKLPLPQ